MNLKLKEKSSISEKKELSGEAPAEKVYNVSELTRKIRKTVESTGRIWLTGEISALKVHSSGHVYLTLKDSDNQISGLIWRNNKKASQTASTLKDGVEVLVSGDITTYGPQSKYQIVISSIQAKGAGALLVAFEKLKKRLLEEGLFAREHKKNIPFLPRRIGLVTSPTGAAIQDMLNVIKRRFPLVEIYIYPVRVQGEGAAPEIAEAIERLNEDKSLPALDVIIVGRGGGSPEDLWAFNEEVVAYAIFKSRIPIISAVGHEVDVSISDFVADKRALTPSEAAELVVPRMDLLFEKLRLCQSRLETAVDNRISLIRSRLDGWSHHRAFAKPLDQIYHQEQKLDILKQKLERYGAQFVHKKQILLSGLRGGLLAQQPSLQGEQQHLHSLAEQMARAVQKRLDFEEKKLHNFQDQIEALSPLGVLERGYAIIYSKDGKRVIYKSQDTKEGEHIWIRLNNSWILARVEKTGP